MSSDINLLPYTDGEKQINKKGDKQDAVTEGSSKNKYQTNSHPPPIKSWAKRNNVVKDKLKMNLKRVIRYVEIPIPSKKRKFDQEKSQKVPVVGTTSQTVLDPRLIGKPNQEMSQKVPVGETASEQVLDPRLRAMKVRLKPPRSVEREVLAVTNENVCYEEIEIANNVEIPTVHVDNSSDTNYDSNKHSNAVLVDGKSVMEQGTQTDIYSWLYKNEKLYSITSDDKMRCITNLVPVIKTTRNSLPVFNDNGYKKVPCNLPKDNYSKKAVLQNKLPAKNKVIAEIVISDDSLSDDDLEEISSSPSSINNKLSKQDSVVKFNDKQASVVQPTDKQSTAVQPTDKQASVVQSNYLLHENSFLDLISSDLTSKSELYNSTDQCSKPQADLILPTNIVHDQPLNAVQTNGNIFLSDSTLGNSFNLASAQLERQQYTPDKFVGSSCSKIDNQTESNQTDVNAFLSQLSQELKNCLVENEFGNIPLQQAVIDGDVKKIQSQCILLKSMKYSLNHVNSRNETALTVAVKMMLYGESRPECKVAEVLLKEGVDQTITDVDGYTPLHYAVKTGRVDLTGLLLKSQLSEKVVNKFGNDGLVPVHLAAIGNHPKIITQLVKYGCDINAQDRKSGRTPYFFALENRSLEAAKALIIHKAITSTENYAGQSPPNIKGFKRFLSVLKSPSHASTLLKICAEQVDEQKGFSFVRPLTTSYSFDGRGRDVKIKTSNSSKAVYDTANGKSSSKFQNNESSNKRVNNSDLFVTNNIHKDNKEMFFNGKDHSSSQSNMSLDIQNPIRIENVDFEILETSKNIVSKLLVSKSTKGIVNNNFNPRNCSSSETSDVIKSTLREKLENTESSAPYLIDSAKTTLFAMDRVNTVGEMSEETPVMEYSCSVKPSGCAVLAVEYGNVLRTLSDGKIENETCLADDPGSVKATSCTSIVSDNGSMFGTVFDAHIGNDSEIIISSCETPSDVVFGSYELSISSPIQEIICDIGPQLKQPDIHEDSGLKRCSDEKTDTTSNSKKYKN